jgi:hypothetical protein
MFCFRILEPPQPLLSWEVMSHGVMGGKAIERKSAQVDFMK